MRLLRLVSNQKGTFGVLLAEIDGVELPFALTLERPWAGNARGVSCIPDGDYTCRRVQSPKFGNTFEVTNVVGRSEILLHTGNIDEDSHGCIIIGDAFDPVLGSYGVVSSKHAFAELLDLTSDVDTFDLSIVWVERP